MSFFGLGAVGANAEQKVLEVLPDATLYAEEYQLLRRIEELSLQFQQIFANPVKSVESSNLLRLIVELHEEKLPPLRERRLNLIPSSPCAQLMRRSHSPENTSHDSAAAAAAAPQEPVAAAHQVVCAADPKANEAAAEEATQPPPPAEPALVESTPAKTDENEFKLDAWDFDQRAIALGLYPERIRMVRKGEKDVEGHYMPPILRENRSLTEMANQINSLINQINNTITSINRYKDLSEEEKPNYINAIQRVRQIYDKIIYQMEFFQAIYFNDGKVFTETAFKYWKPSGNPELIAAKPFKDIVRLEF